jgi:hypothetical protein
MVIFIQIKRERAALNERRRGGVKSEKTCMGTVHRKGVVV